LWCSCDEIPERLGGKVLEREAAVTLQEVLAHLQRLQHRLQDVHRSFAIAIQFPRSISQTAAVDPPAQLHFMFAL